MRPVSRAVLVATISAIIVCVAFAAGPGWMERTHVEHKFSPSSVSIELADAPPGATRKVRVEDWLREHRNATIAAERRFRIDRRAIAGLIAYEALINVHLWRYAGLALWSGPGKVHFKDNRLFEGDPLAKQVEDIGLLPRRSMSAREAILRNPTWASLYIAASMRALADVVRRETALDVSCNPGALVTLETAWDIPSASAHFRNERPLITLEDNYPGNWTITWLPWVERAVGRPSAHVCRKD